MHDIASIVSGALKQALAITTNQKGNVQLMDWKGGCLTIIAHQGVSDNFIDTFRSVRSSDGCACGRALLLRKPVIVDDVKNDLRFPALGGIGEQEGFISVQSTPLISSSGALLGIISTHGSIGLSGEQAAEISLLAARTANEIIRLYASITSANLDVGAGRPFNAGRSRAARLGSSYGAEAREADRSGPRTDKG